MACCASCSRCCCHFLGVLLSLLALGGLVAGLVLLLMYDHGTTRYWAAIGALSGGALLAIFVIVYACVVNRKGWRLYGCINLRYKHNPMLKTLQMLPSKEDLEKTPGANGHVNPLGNRDGAAEKRNSLSSFGNFRNSKTSLDWDPDTILAD